MNPYMTALIKSQPLIRPSAPAPTSPEEWQHLANLADGYSAAATKFNLQYECTWAGLPVIQTPQDLMVFQQIYHEVVPSMVMCTGVAHGGLLAFFASLGTHECDVIGFDIDPRSEQMELLNLVNGEFGTIRVHKADTSDCLDLVKSLKSLTPPETNIMVVLDSCHTKEHVLKELDNFKEAVSPSSYMIVCDTVSTPDRGPMLAIEEWLPNNPEFVIDTTRNVIGWTCCTNGFLRRIR